MEVYFQHTNQTFADGGACWGDDDEAFSIVDQVGGTWAVENRMRAHSRRRGVGSEAEKLISEPPLGPMRWWCSLEVRLRNSR